MPALNKNGTEEESCETGKVEGDQDKKLHFLTAATALALHPQSIILCEPAALSTLDWVLKLGLPPPPALAYFFSPGYCLLLYEEFFPAFLGTGAHSQNGQRYQWE